MQKETKTKVTTTELKISGIRAMRESADFLSGVPKGTMAYLFAETGVAFCEMQIKLPRRGLIASGHIELRNKDGSGTLARLDLKDAIAHKFRFELDTPDDTGPTLDTTFNLMWKTHGDEAETIEPLLDSKCYLDMTFREHPQTSDLFSKSKTAEAEAGNRSKLDRKRRAAGEKESDLLTPAADPEAPPAPPEATNEPPPPSNVVPLTPGKGKGKGLSLAQLEKDAAEHAKKHPRKEPPKPPRGNGGGNRGGPRHH